MRRASIVEAGADGFLVGKGVFYRGESVSTEPEGVARA